MTKKFTHCLLYNPSVAISDLRPYADINSMLRDANSRLNKNQLAKMVRLNWMVQNIKDEPIRKPFLVTNRLIIHAGDTRYAAIQLNNFGITHVPCLMTTTIDNLNPDWIYIHDKDHLAQLRDIEPKNIMVHRDWNFDEIDWIEFAYSDTQHHMHDEDERYSMIVNYLEQYPDTVFTQEWLQTPVNWEEFK